MSHYQEQFKKETGLVVWITIYSEKFKEERQMLNPKYCEWLDEYITRLINFKLSTRIIKDVITKDDKEEEIYVPQAKIGGVWKNALSKNSVIYTQSINSKTPTDSIGMVKILLDNFCKKHWECWKFHKQYNLK